MAKMDELSEFIEKILRTPARTFQGVRLQCRLVIEELGVDSDTAGEKGLLLLRGFLMELERVLKRHGRLAEVEGWLREHESSTPAS